MRGSHDATSLKGQFIMAMPALADPNFFRTVACIAEQNASGGMGLVINRTHPSLTAAEIFGELNVSCAPGSASIPVYVGGPVHAGEIFILHGPPFGWQGCLNITPSLALSNTMDILEAIARGQGPESFLLTLGCAGWGPGQLESELQQNVWLTSPVYEDVIFELPVESRWLAALKRIGIDPSALTETVGHA